MLEVSSNSLAKGDDMRKNIMLTKPARVSDVVLEDLQYDITGEIEETERRMARHWAAKLRLSTRSATKRKRFGAKLAAG
jgi:hypothetical protein